MGPTIRIRRTIRKEKETSEPDIQNRKGKRRLEELHFHPWFEQIEIVEWVNGEGH